MPTGATTNIGASDYPGSKVQNSMDNLKTISNHNKPLHTKTWQTLIPNKISAEIINGGSSIPMLLNKYNAAATASDVQSNQNNFY